MTALFGLVGPLAAAPVIHMIGDSTMADKPRPEHPERGWGQLFKTLVRQPATVENHARNGRSTKSFIREGRWENVVGKLRAGDWVVIQFGHNDEKVDKPNVGAEAHGLYQENLRMFVRASVSHGARPVLATSVARRRWNSNGELVPTHGDYPDVVRKVAREEGVPMVDLEDLTNDLERSLGVEGSKRLHLWFEPGEHPKLPKGLRDDTHYSEEGALRVAKLFAAECQRLRIGIADWIDWSSFENPPLPWSPDMGDGTYVNPVLNADYSDPDVVRVGDDFYMTSSSFCHVPGLPILRSTDLVHWQLVNHALPELVPADRYGVPQHGNGVWAPAIRHHDGMFFIYWGDPDLGIFVVTAEDPAGAWSEPELVLEGEGLIDPCPLWADDGRVWLVHGWAASRAGISNRITLRELTADAMAVKPGDKGVVVIDGADLPGYRTMEGPKFHQKDGWYWIFAPAGGVPTGWQSVFRSRDITGPYKGRIVLDQGRTSVNGPHQGAWVETRSGEDWFLHFQDREAMGRVVLLEPMGWTDDGWPVIGVDPDGNGRGEPVARHRMPALAVSETDGPPCTDLFRTSALGIQWQWQANPRPDWLEMTGNGILRLKPVTPVKEGGSLWHCGALLLQKPAADNFEVRTCLKLDPSAARGTRAGLLVFGDDYDWLGIERGGDGLVIVRATCRGARKGNPERRQVVRRLAGERLWLRLRWSDAGQRCLLSCSEDGEEFTDVGGEFGTKPGRWVGAKFGLFATADEPPTSSGRALFGPVRVMPWSGQ